MMTDINSLLGFQYTNFCQVGALFEVETILSPLKKQCKRFNSLNAYFNQKQSSWGDEEEKDILAVQDPALKTVRHKQATSNKQGEVSFTKALTLDVDLKLRLLS